MVNYGTRTLRRKRRSPGEIAELQQSIRDDLANDHPQSVRHQFYRQSGFGLVEKTEAGYRTVQQQILKMRETGTLPWSWISDGTRWRIKPNSYTCLADAVADVATYYRRDLWARSDDYVEVWCESDSIAGVLTEETWKYDVPLMSSRGFSSQTFLYSAAQTIKQVGKPTHIYYVGDWDPAGKLIPEKIEASIRRHAPNAEVYFKRIMITPEQIVEHDLPTRPAEAKHPVKELGRWHRRSRSDARRADPENTPRGNRASHRSTVARPAQIGGRRRARPPRTPSRTGRGRFHDLE